MSEQQVLPELDIPAQNHNPGVCDCDLVGGDETCKIQPPYLSGLERWRMALKQREDELRTALASLAQSEAERERLKGELSHYPAKWREDSSLATWFPFTAEELARTRNKLQELQLRYVMVDSELPTDFEPELEAEARIMAFGIAHHRLVIELARERELHQGLRQVVKEYRENPSRVHHSSTCKKGVNYPGLGLCDDRCLICRWADSLLEPKAKPVATNAGEEN
jgi:hypothetical protein